MICQTLAWLAFCATVATADFPWLSPVYDQIFQVALPIPSIKVPKRTHTSPATGLLMDYYEVDIKPLEVQVYPNLGKTRLVGYDGQNPGPTFMMTKGREAVVRFINHADRANSDGWADDTTEPGQYKDYYYPNGQNARTLWYHDHAIDHTVENAYYGQAGFYILHDPDELKIPGLPQGDFDIPLTLAAKRYNPDGSLWDPEANNEETSVFVEPRKHRFRILNTGISRSYQLYFEPDKTPGTRSAMTVVGSDTGLTAKPVQTTQLDISIAERWEVVFDFTSFSGQNVTLKNNRQVAADIDYNSTDQVMNQSGHCQRECLDADFLLGFVVGTSTTGVVSKDELPAVLRTVPFPTPKTTVDRSFEFQHSNGRWQINGEVWSDGPEARVLAKPERGAIEVWELKNVGGGWSHPIHIHLVDFQITSRIGGRGQVLPYEAVALKDVIWLNTGETVRVIARYAPWDGLYMFHCHNLIHEDHEMMAAFNVTVLADLGYNDTTRFLDPMEPRYRARFTSHTGVFSDSAIDQKLDFFANLDAYAHEADANAALASYWKTHVAGAPNTLSTSTKSSTTTTSSKSSTTSTVKTTKSSSSTSTKSTASSSAV
ncbi:oxidase cueO precursor [Aureobasidium pullulans]|uniref:Oxidase cueO n=1 Tax=Aureobasidium pullulans TaxID=5580 RepID=A0AB38LXL5_AURPU|nr:oxidase cueO precursor [Aureobasidium pullulans]THZ41525.1 oxidase cueO precursor [Aureobasidium pullulans]